MTWGNWAKFRHLAIVKVQQCDVMLERLFWGIHSVLGKTCKKCPLCPGRRLASTFIFDKLWAKLYSHSWFISEAIILSTSFENNTCQGIRHERNIPQWYCLSELNWRKFVLKMHLSIYGACPVVVKPTSKMTLLYSKIAVMWHVQVKSSTHYFGSFLKQTNSRGT